MPVLCYILIMANMTDYIKWRGDVGMDKIPFGEVDALILCQLSYLNFDGIVPSDFSRTLTLRQAAYDFARADDYETRSDVGALINPDTVQLLQLAGESERFGEIGLCGFINKVELEREEQFSAVTFTRGKNLNFVAFRGTDDNIVGWKEDFNLAFMDTVPSQSDALAYLGETAQYLRGTIMVGGHSKGANLALYSAVNIPKKIQSRISAVYANDGPGFKKEFFERAEFAAIKDRLHAYVPQLSIVGMLFSHADGYITVDSDGRGIRQHDPFTWHILGAHFVELVGLDEESVYISQTVNGWFNALTQTQRELFVQTLFGLLKNVDVRTNSEFTENFGENLFKLLKAATKVDSETREAVMKTVKLLVKYAFKNVGQLKKTPVSSGF